MMVTITVYGRPQQRGSKKPFIIRGGPRKGQASMCDDNKRSAPWMAAVTAAAAEVMDGGTLLTGPVELTAKFFFKRPNSHFGTGRNDGKLKESAPSFHSQQPDLSKLLRAVEDALSGIVYGDDRQITFYGTGTGKYWTAEQERCKIIVRTVGDPIA